MMRIDGAAQPGINLWNFVIRIPFVHYRIERAEVLSGIIMSAACMSAVPLIQQVLEVPYEIAWSVVIINGMLYLLHCFLGDPVSPGWITPSIPVNLAYLLTYTAGPERIKALCALLIMVGVLFAFMGLTGLAGKIVKGIPLSIKSGILLGAGIAAVLGEFNGTGRFNRYTFTISVGCLVMFFMLYSETFKRWKAQNRIVNIFANFGIVPAFLIVVFVGPLFGEIAPPTFTIGSVIMLPDIAGVLKYTIVDVGFPETAYFVQGIPNAVVTYIIAFGDFVTAKALVDGAASIRKDEKVDLDPNRTNLICGIRSVISGFISPFPNLCGPMFSGSYIMIIERYKEGRQAMDSIFSGCGTFRLFTLLGVMLIPVNGLLQNSLPVALSLMMFVQGYVCVALAMGFCKTETDKGVAGIMGAVLVAKGAAWGLAIGIVFYLLLKNYNPRKAAVNPGEGEISQEENTI